MLMNSKKHFTLLELMIVIVIIAIFIAVGAPQLGRFYSSIKFNGSVRQLKTFLIYAGNTALSERKECRVWVNGNHDLFTLGIQKDPINEPHSFELLEGSLSSWKLSNNVKLSAVYINGEAVPVGAKFYFDIPPLGNQKRYIFILGDTQKDTMAVVMQRGSGLVEIKPPAQIKVYD